ncbi:MAG: hypothetical protein ACJAVK_002420 [Akkermansiaceae bacterium]|jgi:hypothetical protein
MLLTTQCIFKGEMDDGEILNLGTTEIPDFLKPFPLFRAGTAHHETRVVEVWWLWDGDTETRIGALNEAQKKLPRSGAADNQGLVIFLEGRTHPSLA